MATGRQERRILAATLATPIYAGIYMQVVCQGPPWSPRSTLCHFCHTENRRLLGTQPVNPAAWYKGDGATHKRLVCETTRRLGALVAAVQKEGSSVLYER